MLPNQVLEEKKKKNMNKILISPLREERVK